MRFTRILRLAQCLAVLLPALTAGCASFDLQGRQKDEIPQATPENPVVKIVCIWEAAEGHGLDGLPTRGFSGQILFFTRQNPSPVQVNGDVRIYLFDDRGTAEEQSQPIHQFDFLSDAWTVHIKQSTLGPAYDIFIPYVRKSSFRKNCGLRLRLVPEAGPTVFSNMVDVTLPGPIENTSDGLVSEREPLPGGRQFDDTPVKLQATLTQQSIALATPTDPTRPVHASAASTVASVPPPVRRLPAATLGQAPPTSPATEYQPADPADTMRPGHVPRRPSEVASEPDPSPARQSAKSDDGRRRRFRLVSADAMVENRIERPGTPQSD